MICGVYTTFDNGYFLEIDYLPLCKGRELTSIKKPQVRQQDTPPAIYEGWDINSTWELM